MKRIISFFLILLLSAPLCCTFAQEKDKIVMPEYPGGQAALRKFLMSELKYPAEARAANEVGEVLVGFSVGMDGSISGVRVLKPVSPALNAEAVRVVQMMKYWRPGTRNGKPVRAEMTIPINFKTVIDNNKYLNDDDGSSKSKRDIF
ncbi:MAG: energy transducer TonB [Bacteroidaceae bacterium]|nr:energy transducer TonB [Bacteroidaceae bacterium]